MNDLGFHKAVVIFIDILGTKDRVEFNEWFQITDIFYNSVECEKQLDSTHPHVIYKREIHIFSDCAYIIYDYKDNIEEHRKSMFDILSIACYNTEKLLCKFLKSSFIARGAITYGDIYYDTSRGIFFGPAMNKAFELESRDAKFPRIIIDPDFAKELYLFNEDKYRSNPFQCLTNGEILKKDMDGFYHLNYLNSYQAGYNCDEFRYIESVITELIKREMTKPRETIQLQESITSKYKWLEKYICFTSCQIDDNN